MHDRPSSCGPAVIEPASPNSLISTADSPMAGWASVQQGRLALPRKPVMTTRADTTRLAGVGHHRLPGSGKTTHAERPHRPSRMGENGGAITSSAPGRQPGVSMTDAGRAALAPHPPEKESRRAESFAPHAAHRQPELRARSPRRSCGPQVIEPEPRPTSLISTAVSPMAGWAMTAFSRVVLALPGSRCTDTATRGTRAGASLIARYISGANSDIAMTAALPSRHAL
jgi:hypothetical protein